MPAAGTQMAAPMNASGSASAENRLRKRPMTAVSKRTTAIPRKNEWARRSPTTRPSPGLMSRRFMRRPAMGGDAMLRRRRRLVLEIRAEEDLVDRELRGTGEHVLGRPVG